MEKEIKIILVVGILFIIFVNLTRIVWQFTNTEINNSNALKVACLKGGGEVIENGFMDYLNCKPEN